jgi:hypothetical protein
MVSSARLPTTQQAKRMERKDMTDKKFKNVNGDKDTAMISG